MAFAQKLTTTATGTKTHAVEDASLVDIINPTVSLTSTGNVIRGGVYALAAWVGRGYKESKTFSL